MTIKLPRHCFNYWTNPVSKQIPVLIVGAGLSSGLAPRPDELVKELQPKQIDIEARLGLNTHFELDRNSPQTLYIWAERCISELTKEMSEKEAKVHFARAIGLMNDARFAGRANVPLRGTTPRHRVIARLAREGCIHSVWSTNWDLWLEAAFDSVGIQCITKTSSIDAPLPAAWITRYEAWLPPKLPDKDEQTLTLFKPHGCVRALHEGNTLFLITDAELKKPLKDQEIKCVERMRADLTDNAACVIGWSASEGYLQELFNDLKHKSTLSNTLAIIDPFPKLDSTVANGDTHLKLIEAYGKDINDVVCEVKPSGLGTTDDLMLWVQLQRGINVLAHVCADESSIVEVCRRHSQSIPVSLPRNESLGWVASWFDSFLPVWLRLCFNCQAQEFYDGIRLQPNALPIHLRDAHIPWGYTGLLRRDLRAAASIYRYLDHTCGSNNGWMNWDFEAYPGGFWDPEDQHLLLPVPIWCEIDSVSLAVLKPLIDSHHWNDKGRIRILSIAPIQCDAPRLTLGELDEQLARWKQELCSLMPHAAFATEHAISTVSFE